MPGPPTDLQARRSGDEVRLRFVLPTANVQGQGRIELHRIEVFAATVAADSPAPPNRDLLVDRFLVGTIDVKPPATQADEPAAEGAPKDSRPAPGEVATFVETLNAAKLTPQVKGPALPAGAAPDAPAASEQGAPLRRIYVARGSTERGRPGQPSQRIVLPLADVPAPPTGVAVAFDAQKVTVSWMAPVSPLGSKGPLFNVYAPDGSAPLNSAPLAATSFDRRGVAFGAEECFVVRTAVVIANVTIESEPTPATCITPTDTFAPAAPKGLAAVGMAGAVNLIWEANTEADLAGYIVLRGEAPGDTLQAITAKPIVETTYRDATAVAGVRYVYAVVAVDRATPPNTSPQSNRVEESAR